MKRLVMKFGGTSLADADNIRRVAAHVQRERDAGYQVVVVVSAMAGDTNRLIGLVGEIAPTLFHADSDKTEYDVIVSAGEQVSAGLLALALQEMGVAARSWLGWQLPIKTDGEHASARISDIDASDLITALNENNVCVVAGFQGLEEASGRITTLGRGGSDTSAVALAAALKAERCDIYTDVDGVYTTDPNLVSEARRMARISYEEMLEMASSGARVLQTRSVELAMARRVKVLVRSSFESPNAKNTNNGTLICDEDEIMEQEIVSGIAYTRNEAKITLLGVEDKPGIAARLFGPLADAQINVDMIVQNMAAEGKTTDVTFTVPQDELARALAVIEKSKPDVAIGSIHTSENMAKVSIVGVAMRSHAGVAQKMFHELGAKNINIHVISTSEIKVSVLIDAEQTEAAVRALHVAYGLDKK